MCHREEIGASVSQTVLYDGVNEEGEGWEVYSSGSMIVAVAHNVQVAGSSWTMVECPYTVPEGLRPAVGTQAPAYSYPVCDGARILVSEEGEISIGSGASGASVNGGFYGQVVWVPATS